MALAVTIADAVIAFPLAYYMAKFASPRLKTFLYLAVTASAVVQLSGPRLCVEVDPRQGGDPFLVLSTCSA